jgi:hypothetical protein
MAELFPQSAARLSEDIGDVLSAIRRLIADNHAPTALPEDRIGDDGLSRSSLAGPTVPMPDQIGDSRVRPLFVQRRLRLDVTRRVDLGEASTAPIRIEPESKQPVSPQDSWTLDQPQPGHRDFADYREEDDFADAFAWKGRAEPAGVAALPEPVAQTANQTVMHPAMADTCAVPEPHAAAMSNRGFAVEQVVIAPHGEHDLRDCLRAMIREELQGEFGQRFSSNLRALIRREVSVAIDQQLDRL